MIRFRILNITRHRNIPVNRSISIINPKSASNLEQRNVSRVFNDTYSQNYTSLHKTMYTLLPVASNRISLNSKKSSKFNRTSSHKPKTPHSFHSSIHTLTECKTLLRFSSSSLEKHKCCTGSSIKPFGVRHYSSEVIDHFQRPVLTGFWKDMSESAPVEFVQDSLISFQSLTNLPWWATILLTTLIVRGTMTLPLSLYQHYILAKVQNLQVDMNDAVEKLKLEANIAVSHHNWSEDYARVVYDQALKRKWKELLERENCHPAKGFIVLWTQIPLWITISAALRNLCYMLPPSHANAEKIYFELTTGGFGWVENLIAVDPYWILPLSIAVFNLANIEVMTLLKRKEDTKFQKYMLFFFRFISIAMLPIATYVPSCICLYWASSSAFGLAQNLLLLSPKVRRLGRVPITSTERENPYRELIAKFREKKYFKFGGKDANLE